MGCTHAETCPLFPKLRDSLIAWRHAYCDDDTAWTGCARYTMSLTGQTVPLALLPTGKMVSHFSSTVSATTTGDAATATPTVSSSAATVVLDRVAPVTDAAHDVDPSSPRTTLWRRRKRTQG